MLCRTVNRLQAGDVTVITAKKKKSSNKQESAPTTDQEDEGGRGDPPPLPVFSPPGPGNCDLLMLLCFFIACQEIAEAPTVMQA